MRRYLGFAFVAMLLMGGVAAATRFDDGATEEAFAALLQMPGPPDAWHPASSDGTTPMSQDELIAALADWKQEGANFNAYRHKGPLLHHALRLDQQKIALWLLRHGADPTLTIELSSIGKTDALGLAIHKGQWHVVDAMLALPAYKRLSAAELTERYLPGNPQALSELMARGFAPPTGLTGSCMLAYELHRGSFADASKLPATTVPPVASSIVEERLHNVCEAYGPDVGIVPPTMASLDPAVLAKLDSHLVEPLFPYVVPLLRQPADVDALFALPIRKPSTPAALAAAVADQIAPTPVGVARAHLPADVRLALAKRLDKAAFGALLSTDDRLYGWLVQAANESPQRFAEFLALVSDETLAAHSESAASVVPANKTAASMWKSLLARTTLRLDRDAAPVDLLTRVPTTSWPELFARGYRPGRPPSRERPSDVDAWIQAASIEDVRAGWPVIAAHDRPLADGIVGRLVWKRRWDMVSECPSAADVPKLQTLLDLGAARRAWPVPAACRSQGGTIGVAGIDALGVVAPPDAADGHRFVLDPTPCKVATGPQWAQALLEANKAGDVDAVQAIAMPGASTCALLVTTGHGVNRLSLHDDSFESGESEAGGCGDSTFDGALLSEDQGRISTTQAGEGGSNGVLAMRDTRTGKRYLWARAQGGSTCGVESPSRVFAWTTQIPNGLDPLRLDTPESMAVDLQCTDPDDCFGAHHVASDGWLPEGTYELNAFMNTFYAENHTDYLAAVDALDKDRLKSVEAAGVNWPWTAEALVALNASPRSLPEKRLRVAWLFRDSERLRHAVSSYEHDDEFVTLLTWLPHEDWKPLLRALVDKSEGEDPNWHLRSLATKAADKNLPEIACQLWRSAGDDCSAS